MPIRVTRRLNIDSLLGDTIARVKPAFEKALIDEATEISIRARAGKLITGSSAPPLSRDYKRVKEKSGRKGLPDFTFTGSMLAAIATAVEQRAYNLIGKIFFSSAREAAKAEGNQRLRPFFGLSKEQVQRIKQRLKEALRK